jgi:hypothetical protein
VALASNRIPGTSIDPAGLASKNPDEESPTQLAIDVLLGNDISPQTRKIIEDQFGQDQAEIGAARLPKAFALVLGSPEFQKR